MRLPPDSVMSVATTLALNNNHKYAIAAVLMRHNTPIRIGINRAKSSPKNKIIKTNNETVRCDLHAEVDAISCDLRSNDTLYVFRVRRDLKRTMAKPCSDCAYKLGLAGIRKVYYTDWNGDWQKL